MYAWIWRHLPFGLPGKVTGSALIVAALAASLWLWVFPWLEPLMPFDDVRVESPLPGPLPAGGTTPDPTVPTPSASVPSDPFAVPYSTVSNNPPPPPTP